MSLLGFLKDLQAMVELHLGLDGQKSIIKDDNIVKNPLYAYFIVNSVSTIGLFLLSFYKEQYPKIVPQYPTDLNPHDLPF